MNNDENVHEDGAGAPEGAEGLAQAIFTADEMKRQAALDREREEKAAAGLRLASKVLCSRAIDELKECESWPTPRASARESSASWPGARSSSMPTRTAARS